MGNSLIEGGMSRPIGPMPDGKFASEKGAYALG